MSANNEGQDPIPEEVINVWRIQHQLDILHSELASLYRTKSSDRKRINMLWSAIEAKEADLVIEGVTP